MWLYYSQVYSYLTHERAANVGSCDQWIFIAMDPLAPPNCQNPHIHYCSFLATKVSNEK